LRTTLQENNCPGVGAAFLQGFQQRIFVFRHSILWSLLTPARDQSELNNRPGFVGAATDEASFISERSGNGEPMDLAAGRLAKAH
jgi:hypothetical protein